MEWLRATIGINGFPMAWGKPTIGNDGFRWLCTIGPTMEWLCTIVEVYCRDSLRYTIKMLNADFILLSLANPSVAVMQNKREKMEEIVQKKCTLLKTE